MDIRFFAYICAAVHTANEHAIYDLQCERGFYGPERQGRVRRIAAYYRLMGRA